MNCTITRQPEPERMTAQEEEHYANADYSQAHEEFVDEVLAGCSPAIHNVTAGDLGSGPGDILFRLCRRRPTWNFYGVDVSDQMLAFARRAGNANGASRLIRWVRADIKDTHLPTGLFDVVISNSVLHHLEEPVHFWREVARLANRGAFVFVRDLRRPLDEYMAHALVERHVSAESRVVQEHYLSSLYSAFTPAEVRKQLQAAELSGLNVRSVGDRYLDVYGRVEANHRIGA